MLRPRSVHGFVSIAALLTAISLLLACSSDSAVGFADGGGFPDGWEDPVVCVGDPDTVVICKKESDFWDCASMPNAEVKCTHTEPQTPGGGATWECEEVGTEIVCSSSDATSPPGGGDWNCVQEGEFLVCKKDAPTPPQGSGTFDCYLDSEFNWVCTGTPPTTPPSTVDGGTTSPPSGSMEICYEAVDSTGLPVPPEGYWAKIVAERVLYNGEPAAHIMLYLSKAFVDNTYGDWSIGYSGGPGVIGGGHSFGDLAESDKMEIFIDDTKGNLLFHMALDYISQSSAAPSGHASLGVTGGEGQMLKGDASAVLAVQTSLSVNLNGHGYVLLKDSPETDENYTPNAQYPHWIFDVWYEAWVRWSAFGETGPGRVYITGLHASPNKVGERNLEIQPVPCP